MDPITLFKDGGLFAYALIGASPVVVFAILALGVCEGLRFRVPTAAWLFGPLGLLGMGALGSLMGLNMTLDAVAHASQEVKSTLAANGFSVSLYTLIIGGGLATVATALSAWPPAIALAARPGEHPTLTMFHALPGAAAAFLSLVVGCAFGSILVTGVGVVGGLAIAVAAARAPEHRDWKPRAAESRLRTASLAATAALFATITTVATGHMMALSAQAKASAETRDVLIAAGLEAADPVPGAFVAFLLVFAGVVSALPYLGDLTGRSMIGGVIGAGVLLAGLTPTAYLGSTMAGMSDLLVPSNEKLAIELSDAGIDLPRANQTRAFPPEGPILTVGPEGIEVDGAQVSPLGNVDAEAVEKALLQGLTPSDGWSTPTIKLGAHADLKVKLLIPVLRALPAAPSPDEGLIRQVASKGDATVAILTSRDGAAYVIRVATFDEGKVRPPDGHPEEQETMARLALTPGRYVLGTRSGALGQSATTTDLGNQIREFKSRYPDVMEVEVAMDPSMTWGEAVSALDVLPGDLREEFLPQVVLLLPPEAG